MGLRVFIGKDNFSKPDEGDFIYQFAYALKVLFNENDYEGMFFGTPLVKGRSERYLPIDAVIFAKNAIIVIELKSHGGVILTPTCDSEYMTGAWSTDEPGPDKNIKGGKYANPFNQVQTYKSVLRKDILFDIPGVTNSYINTGVVFYGNDADVSKAYIPNRLRSNFFIATSDFDSANSYYFKIKSILGSRERERTVKLSDADLIRIRQKFIAYEELTDDFIDKMTGMSKEEKELRDRQFEAMQKEIRKRDSEIAAKGREIEEKDRELADKDEELAEKNRTNSLLAEKNLDLIRENKQKNEDNIKLRTENLRLEKEREELQRKAKELLQQKDLSPEMTEKLDQIYYDIKALKIRDFGKEVGGKWEQEFIGLKQELADLKKNSVVHNVYFVPNKKPKWWTALVSGVVCLFAAGLIGVAV